MSNVPAGITEFHTLERFIFFCMKLKYGEIRAVGVQTDTLPVILIKTHLVTANAQSQSLL